MCICLAFVPMFGLGGVAGYLFPSARGSSSVRADCPPTSCPVPSFPRWRTICCAGRAHEATPGPSRNPLVRFQQGFERPLRSHPQRFMAVYSPWGLRNRGKLIAGFVGFSLPFVRACSVPGSGFLFQAVDGGQIKMHVRAADGYAHRGGPPGLRIGLARRSTRLSPPMSWTALFDKHRAERQRYQYGLQQLGGRSASRDADILHQPQGRHHAPTADYVRTMRESGCRRIFPSASFAFLPADMVSQILNFGVPRTDRSPDRR